MDEAAIVQSIQARVEQSAQLRARVASQLAAVSTRRMQIVSRTATFEAHFATVQNVVNSVKTSLANPRAATTDLISTPFNELSGNLSALRQEILPDVSRDQLRRLQGWPDQLTAFTESAQGTLRDRLADAAAAVELAREQLASHAEGITEKTEEYTAAIQSAKETVIGELGEVKTQVLEHVESWTRLSASGSKGIAELCTSRLKDELETKIGETCSSALQAIQSVSDLAERSFGEVQNSLHDINGTIVGVMHIIEPIKPAVELMGSI